MPFPDIQVSERKNGDLVLLAGQHRLAAAIELEITELWASVFLGLEDIEEAEIFDREANHRALTPYDRHENARAMGDSDAFKIDLTLRDLDIRLTRGGKGKRDLSAVSAVYKVYRWGVLGPSASVLVEWCEEHDATPSGDILVGIGYLLKERGESIDIERLRRVLRNVSPFAVRAQVSAMSRGSRPGTTQFRNWANAILPLYNKKLKANRLHLVGEEEAA